MGGVEKDLKKKKKKKMQILKHAKRWEEIVNMFKKEIGILSSVLKRLQNPGKHIEEQDTNREQDSYIQETETQNSVKP